jgi:hypothetical protein
MLEFWAQLRWPNKRFKKATSVSSRFGIRVVAEVVKTFDDSRCGSKLLTSSATQKLNLDKALVGPINLKLFNSNVYLKSTSNVQKRNSTAQAKGSKSKQP